MQNKPKLKGAKRSGLTCQRCGSPLTSPDKCTWLELNLYTLTYHVEGIVPKNESQGFFEFGDDCAEKIILNNGKLN